MYTVVVVVYHVDPIWDLVCMIIYTFYIYMYIYLFALKCSKKNIA